MQNSTKKIYGSTLSFKNLRIQGFLVKFPCTPYKSQLAFMSSALSALRNRSSALLESPTGSGKSIALIASALAFQKVSPPEDSLRIYIATRTHSQIKQMVNELSRFEPVYSFRMTPLGSRKHSCVHPIIKLKPNLNEECRSAIGKNACPYFSRANRLANAEPLKKVHDLEDVVKLSKSLMGCPYYATRANLERADVVITPYQYLLDPSTRRSMNLRLKNSVIFFDEAHNIENVCRDSVSKSFKLGDWKFLVADLKEQKEREFQVGAVEYILKFLEDFLEWCYTKIESLYNKFVNNNQISYNNKFNYNKDNNKFSYKKNKFNYNNQFNYKTSKPPEKIRTEVLKGDELSKILNLCGLDKGTFKEFLSAVAAVTKSDEDSSQPLPSSLSPETLSKDTQEGTETKIGLKMSSIIILENLSVIISILFKGDLSHFRDYRFALELPSSEDLKARQNLHREERDMSSAHFWCMNPAVAIEKLFSKCHSVILTSGTLSPMGSFDSELGTNFPVKLQAEHVVEKPQFFAAVLGSNRAGEDFIGTYKNVDKFVYQDSVGEAVLEGLKRVVRFFGKGGVLVFLASYSLQQKLRRRWGEIGLLDKMRALSQRAGGRKGGSGETVFFEPKGSGDDFKQTIKQFKKTAQISGALLVAVCRGKASEGIDFSDELSRLVFVVGIPYASFGDALVKQKIEWNDEMKTLKGFSKKGEYISGRVWYELQAFRALNQAAGRCIRHRFDFGGIVFIDCRFQNLKVKGNISKWIVGNMRKEEGYERVWEGLERFFGEVKGFVERRRAIYEKPKGIGGEKNVK